MPAITRALKRILNDIAAGKHIELYAVSLVAFALAVLSVIEDVVSLNVKLAALLAGLGLLVFKATEPEKEALDLDSVLRDRQSYGPFREFVRGGQEVCIYGPSAVNVLSNAPDIEREVLRKGGRMRVILQDPAVTWSIEVLRAQLDKMAHLLESDIARSLSILDSMQKQGEKVDYRLLKYNPGFSMVLVDPQGKNGRAIVEFYGFNSAIITDRMHIEIHRDQSQYWFEYWATQFENMWQAAREPQAQP